MSTTFAANLVGRTVQSIQRVSEGRYRIYLASGKSLVMHISEGQCCCEKYGVFLFHDGVANHENQIEVNDGRILEVYSNIPQLDCADELYAQSMVTSIKEWNGNDDYYEHKACLKLVTTAGTFEIVLYNEHNGYYPHDFGVVLDGVQRASGEL